VRVAVVVLEKVWGGRARVKVGDQAGAFAGARLTRRVSIQSPIWCASEKSIESHGSIKACILLSITGFTHYITPHCLLPIGYTRSIGVSIKSEVKMVCPSG
jgi:hypothetical protein